MSKSFDHWDNLKNWNVDPRVAERVDETCFRHIRTLSDGYRVDLSFVSAVIKRYNPKDSCFELNGIRLVPTLYDVFMCTGLPVDGTAVSGEESAPAALCIEHLGRILTEEGEQKISVKLHLLKQHFEVVPSDMELQDGDIWRYVKAYLLYLIGSVVVPSKLNDVSLAYLNLLEPGIIDGFAWGAALLAHLHSELCKYKEKNNDSAGGCMFF